MTGPKIRKAFILAAGLGTRLMPLTNDLPKALVPYKGKPMIENVIAKLVEAGINEIIVNVHHFADKMDDYFSQREGAGNITLIHEKQILGTGGAIKNAEEFLSDAEDFLVYNTDVDCDIEIDKFCDFHFERKGIASLCVQKRKTTRYLICDIAGKLVGRTENGENIFYLRSENEIKLRAFCGIHLINKRLFRYLDGKTGFFDVIPEYMSIISRGEDIFTHDISEIYWKDLGIPQNL